MEIKRGPIAAFLAKIVIKEMISLRKNLGFYKERDLINFTQSSIMVLTICVYFGLKRNKNES